MHTLSCGRVIAEFGATARPFCSPTPETLPLSARPSLLRSPAGAFGHDALLTGARDANEARSAPDFAKRNVKVIGISANGLEDHHAWAKDIEEWGAQFAPTSVEFPIVRPHTQGC